MVIVARMSLTVAYPIAIGAALVLLTLGARVFLGEAVTPIKIFGTLLVFAGIVALTRWLVGQGFASDHTVGPSNTPLSAGMIVVGFVIQTCDAPVI